MEAIAPAWIMNGSSIGFTKSFLFCVVGVVGLLRGLVGSVGCAGWLVRSASNDRGW